MRGYKSKEVRDEAVHALFFVSVTILAAIRFAAQFRRAEYLTVEMEKLNQNQEKLVKERTRQLIEQQERRQTLTHNIFHDLRSPLFALKNQIEKLPEESAFKASLQERLCALVEEVAASIRERAAEKGCALNLATCAAAVWGDALRLKQALQNLADNALRHADQGGQISFHHLYNNWCSYSDIFSRQL